MKNKTHCDGADVKNSTVIGEIYLGCGTSVGSGYSNGRSHGAYQYIRGSAKVNECNQHWIHPKGDCDDEGNGDG